MARNDPKFMLRLSAELKNRLQEIAADTNRSLNFEITERIEKSLEYDEFLSKINACQLASNEAVFTDMIRLYLSALHKTDIDDSKEFIVDSEQAFRDEMRSRLTLIEKKLSD